MAKTLKMLNIQMKRNIEINHDKNQTGRRWGYKLGALFQTKFVKFSQHGTIKKILGLKINLLVFCENKFIINSDNIFYFYIKI